MITRFNPPFRTQVPPQWRGACAAVAGGGPNRATAIVVARLVFTISGQSRASLHCASSTLSLPPTATSGNGIRTVNCTYARAAGERQHERPGHRSIRTSWPLLNSACNSWRALEDELAMSTLQTRMIDVSALTSSSSRCATTSRPRASCPASA